MVFLAESPNDNFLKHALALEYLKLGKDEEALQRFQANLDTDPAYVPTYYHFGKLLERLGQEPKAIAVYEQGMQAARNAGDNHAFSELRSVYEELTF